ncbi:hypothetical protein MWU59_08805 [Flavobacteriaceae bacterium F08102]|nr:hypothetical protein [Flavobacteriaceae bacterium F08102]
MARRIYRILIGIAIGIGAYLILTRASHSDVFLISISSVVFLLMSVSTHGLIAHSVRPKIKEGLFGYPLLMGLVTVILFLLFIFFIIPALSPDFFYLKLK